MSAPVVIPPAAIMRGGHSMFSALIASTQAGMRVDSGDLLRLVSPDTSSPDNPLLSRSWTSASASSLVVGKVYPPDPFPWTMMAWAPVIAAIKACSLLDT